MNKLFLLRHLKSQWNKLDIWAGWCDNPLSDIGKEQSKAMAELLKQEQIDIAYSNALIRSTETLLRIYDYIPERYPLFFHLDDKKMKDLGKFTDGNAGNYLPVYVSQALNERFYGQLQGMNKAEAKQKYGEDQVRQWRTSYKSAPPKGESGPDIFKRVYPFYKKYIEKDIRAGKNVLVVASHHSLRAIVKNIQNVPDEEMINIEIPFGALVTYDFDGKTFVKKQ